MYNYLIPKNIFYEVQHFFFHNQTIKVYKKCLSLYRKIFLMPN